ncbi:MAG TPA: hypothetical protein VEZ90_08760, partial [Blastocatellia bacterium]|nr:hypothetical protein [Blastocatellia bacterium]
VCAGPDSSPTMGEIRDLTLEILDRHPLAQKWRPIEAPKLVTLPEYEKYVEKSRASGDKLLSELLRVLDHFLPQMGISQRFENRQVLRILEESGIKLPRFRDYYFKIVNYCLETNWGRGYQRSG